MNNWMPKFPRLEHARRCGTLLNFDRLTRNVHFHAFSCMLISLVDTDHLHIHLLNFATPVTDLPRRQSARLH